MTAYEPGSFRDPDSAVFTADGKVLRGLSGQAADDWDRLRGTLFFPRLTESGQIVRTSAHDGDAPPSPRGRPWARVLEHERIPVVSYPYEWPFGMMRQAAALHLEVLAAALDEGLSLKDGTAYNVQFVGARPTFIDIGSFEASTGPWPGYRQFCQTMLFPLLVQAHVGVPYQPLLRGAVDGLSPSDVAGMFSGLRRFRKGVLRNVTLHSVLERKVTTASETVKADLKSSGFSTELAKATVKNLLKLVNALEVAKRGSSSDDDHSVWSDYRATCSYSDDDAKAKQAFVRAALDDGESRVVLDLGANDGEYSLLAADHADYVVAVDGDEKVVDLLYRRLRAAGKENILPLVMNLVDPSGGIGWRQRAVARGGLVAGVIRGSGRGRVPPRRRRTGQAPARQQAGRPVRRLPARRVRAPARGAVPGPPPADSAGRHAHDLPGGSHRCRSVPAAAGRGLRRCRSASTAVTVKAAAGS